MPPLQPGRRWNRRSFLGTAALGAAGAAAYTRWIEPGWLEIAHRQLPLAGGTAPPLRVLHLSDLHHGYHGMRLSYLQRAIRMALQKRPDLVCLTGDYISGHLHSLEAYRRILAELADRVPTYACLGNHDGGDWSGARGGYADPELVCALLQGAGIRVLRNEHARFERDDRQLQLVGVNDLWSGGLDPRRAYEDVDPDGGPILLLCHNPDAKTQLADYPWKVMLAGHTHGGQLRIPLVGTPFAPVRDKRYVDGLRTWGTRWIQVTRGVGNLHHLRFNCRPEIVLLDV